ncbi:LuxR C-terminal-related transcriptional regulator [Microbacterium radiodurans]|uniref:Response regulator transcription factor n=1 Tax=Microbacterium radiodurans TaxID=661398 RepID=A0A5J5IMX3_9MICO|nr:LuxR C-terminal-related transcriptional regulator [Microbacterium radiodurans]KAA9083753.1 response regulator transcription factor [Microbacterium radiodurans]
MQSVVDATAERVALSPQDLLVLQDLAAGRTLDVIARRQHLSERSIRRRVKRACETLGVETGIEAVVRAVRLGLI